MALAVTTAVVRAGGRCQRDAVCEHTWALAAITALPPDSIVCRRGGGGRGGSRCALCALAGAPRSLQSRGMPPSPSTDVAATLASATGPARAADEALVAGVRLGRPLAGSPSRKSGRSLVS